MNNIVKLKENSDFRRAYAKGRAFVTPCIVIYILKNRTSEVRLGITTSKKLGNAVSRNRAKRVITAAFRFCKPYIKPGFDFIVVARSRVLNSKSTQVSVMMEKQLKIAGVWNELNKNEQYFDQNN